jgi:hypothetical protein
MNGNNKYVKVVALMENLEISYKARKKYPEEYRGLERFVNLLLAGLLEDNENTNQTLHHPDCPCVNVVKYIDFLLDGGKDE